MRPTGDEIRQAREALGLSRPKLAARIEGVSLRSLVRAENDEAIGERIIEAIARHLKLGDYRVAGPTIREATEVELVEELLRRAIERAQQGDLHDPPQGDADVAPLDQDGYLREAARHRRHLRNLDNPDVTKGE